MADRGPLRRRGRPHRGHGLRLHRGRLIDADDLHPFRADASLIGDALRHPHPVTDRRGFAVARYLGARLNDEPRRRVSVHLGTRVKPGAHHKLPARLKPGARVKPGAQFKPGARLKPGARVKPGTQFKPGARFKLAAHHESGARFKPSAHRQPDARHKFPARNKPVACVDLSISHRDPVVDSSAIDPAGNAYVSPANPCLPHGCP